MISEIGGDALEFASNRGPQVAKTQKAQNAVDEFLGSGMDACSVDWHEIHEDFDQAKRTIAYRISHSKYMKLEGSQDLSMRSNRSRGEIYLVHLDRVK